MINIQKIALKFRFNNIDIIWKEKKIYNSKLI